MVPLTWPAVRYAKIMRYPDGPGYGVHGGESQ